MNEDRPKREKPTLSELNLLIERFHAEKDPQRKLELQEQIDAMRDEIAAANQD
ncbi:MAG: hypothetical protein U5L04_10905 [Trueperaceae bacterium]|nr:hypothetical protein [Trueperaceae bacterium]